MEDERLEYKLMPHHIKMLRIGTSQRYIKGKVHVLFDFIDPCDQVTSLLWYQGHDPFEHHHFSQGIPNPRTREKANGQLRLD